MHLRFQAAHLASAGLFVLLAAACSSGGAPTPRTPAPEPTPDSARVAPAHEYVVRHDVGRWRYQVQTEASVTLTGDSAAQTEPIRSLAIYSVAIDSAPGGYQVAGRVDSTALTAGGRVPPHATDSVRAGFSARIDSAAGLSALTMDSTRAPSCVGGVDPTVADARSLFYTMPARLHSGLTWEDSTTVVTCRGTVPVSSTIRRRYVAGDTTSWNGRRALRVNVTSESTLQGAGVASAAGDSIHVAGTGTSSGAVLIDPGTAMPLSTSFTGQATVTVTTRQTSLPFAQRVTQSVTLLDGPTTRP